MLRLTKARLSSLIGSAEAKECKMAWVKDKMVQFKGSLRVNHELTYNPLVRHALAILGRGRQPLSRIVDDCTKNPLVSPIVQQTLYALVNAEFVRFERDGEETLLEVRNPRKLQQLLSGSLSDGERISLAAYVWLRNRTWMEEPLFIKEGHRLERAIEVPSDDMNLSTETSHKEIERIVLQHPPSRQAFREIHGTEEDRNEVLEKAGLLNVKIKIVGLDIESAAFIEQFWISQCFVFIGVPDTCGCVVRVLGPSRREHRHSFESALQQIVEKNETFRQKLIQESDEVDVV